MRRYASATAEAKREEAMKDWIGRHRPSPGVAVAIAALVAALAGSAVAQPVANKAVTKKIGRASCRERVYVLV